MKLEATTSEIKKISSDEIGKKLFGGSNENLFTFHLFFLTCEKVHFSPSPAFSLPLPLDKYSLALGHSFTLRPDESPSYWLILRWNGFMTANLNGGNYHETTCWSFMCRTSSSLWHSAQMSPQDHVLSKKSHSNV